MMQTGGLSEITITTDHIPRYPGPQVRGLVLSVVNNTMRKYGRLSLTDAQIVDRWVAERPTNVRRDLIEVPVAFGLFSFDIRLVDGQRVNWES